MPRDIIQAFVAWLVGFGLGCAILHVAIGQSKTFARPFIDMAYDPTLQASQRKFAEPMIAATGPDRFSTKIYSWAPAYAPSYAPKLGVKEKTTSSWTPSFPSPPQSGSAPSPMSMSELSPEQQAFMERRARERGGAAPAPARSTSGRGDMAGAKAVESGVIVSLEIKPDRIEDFLKVMEEDAVKSRDEPGCYRFDLLRNKDDPNRFLIYEAYVDDEAAAFHKTTAHYKLWAEFKASGGVVSQMVYKFEADSIPGDWAFQLVGPARASVGIAVLVTVKIKPGHMEDFFKAMSEDVQMSRKKDLDPGCLRFDLLRDKDNPNIFYFYEAYTDDEAVAFHKTTRHYNAWNEFVKTGGVASKWPTVKLDTVSIPGDWAFQ